jgi:Mn2+/Fe2+ NRAMP family transporter
MIETPRTTSHAHTAAGPLTGYRHGFDLAYGYLMGAFVIAVLVQIYLAGVGAFGEHKTPHSGAFDPHENLGHYLGIAAVLLLILALVAHVSTSTMVWALVLALLTEVAQEGLASGGRSVKWVGGFHAFDAALILALSCWLFYTWRRRQAASSH